MRGMREDHEVRPLNKTKVCVYGGREEINLIRIVYHEVVRCESKRMASVYLS